MQKRILIDGVFDLFHIGHIKLLMEIKESGNYYIIVGTHSDEDVKSYKRTPILKMKERAFAIRACRYVDEVIENAPLIVTKEYIKEYNIDLVFHAHSKEDHEKYTKFYTAPQEMGIFRRVDYHDGISTSDIINRCKKYN